MEFELSVAKVKVLLVVTKSSYNMFGYEILCISQYSCSQNKILTFSTNVVAATQMYGKQRIPIYGSSFSVSRTLIKVFFFVTLFIFKDCF